MSLINHKQSQVIVKTLAEKQAYWAEQLPVFEQNYWLPNHFEFLKFDMDQGNYIIKNIDTSLTTENFDDSAFDQDADDAFHRVNTGWAMWKKAVSHMRKQLEGCVVVPVEPTSQMIHAAADKHREDKFMTYANIYRTMVEAARSGNEQS